MGTGLGTCRRRRRRRKKKRRRRRSTVCEYRCRVPVRVHHDQPAASYQVKARPACLGRQQEDAEDAGWVIKVLNLDDV